MTRKKTPDAIRGPSSHSPAGRAWKTAGTTSPSPPGEGRENGVKPDPIRQVLYPAFRTAQSFTVQGKANKQTKNPPCFPLPALEACGAVTKETARPITGSQPFETWGLGKGGTPAKIPTPVLFFRSKLENTAGWAEFGIVRALMAGNKGSWACCGGKTVAWGRSVHRGITCFSNGTSAVCPGCCFLPTIKPSHRRGIFFFPLS